ncbi:MAG: single-stranded DNA-binding protein [Desulfovibrio sp.]|nr:MAG: single-stranded DNA-binding protein [Desulfovibrio sp.]
MAASLNKVMLIGRLGRDPELRYTQSGTPVANFSMATDESYRGKDGNMVEQTEWHNIVVWNKQGENCANYLSKGRLVFVEGRLQTRKWQDKQGQDRYTTEIVASRVQFLEPRGGASTGASDTPPPPGDADFSPSQNDDMGPAFPSEASGMDDVPF